MRCFFFAARKESSVKWEEIRAQYAGQWLLIEYQELDEQLNVVAGEVVAHSPDKEEIYKRLLETQGKNIAIEYAGELSQDVAVMFRVCPDIS
jgi:hypothetical protein